MPIRLLRPAPCCFPKPESRNPNHLVLIPFCLARATRAGASPAEAPATRAAGHAASALPSGAFPDLAARPLSAEALSNLLDRKPHLLRSLAIQLLPPSRAAVDPAERLGIDLSAWRTADDCGQVMATVLAAIARGEIAPAEGARIAAGACPVALGPQAGSSGFSRRKRAKTASELLREGLCCRPGVVARDAALRRIEASVGGKHG